MVRQVSQALPENRQLTLSKGHFPNFDHYLCRRGLPCHASTIPDNLRQLVLGYGTASCGRYPQRHAHQNHRMGISYPLRHPMDLARSDLSSLLFRTRISMVSLIPDLVYALLTILDHRWLVRHGKIDEARSALLRLTSRKNKDFNVEDTLAMMIHTNELEIQQTSGTSYIDCFKGIDRRRTELTIMTWLIQQTSGSPMIGWGTYFMEQVGLTPTNAYSLGVAQSAMGFCGTVGSWFLMPHFGRRTLYLWGQIVMFIGLMIIGCLGIPHLMTSTGWAIGALMLCLTFVYDFTVGPVCYSLVAELPSTRLRIKTVVLSRNVYNVAGIIIGTLQPRFMNPTAWNWGAKTAFFWGGMNLLGLIWTFFRLPEPKGLTYADLDVLFENKVSARKFRKVEVDPYRSDNLVIVPEEGDSEQEVVGEKKGY